MPPSDPPTRENPRLIDDRGQPIARTPRRRKRSFLFRLIRTLVVLGFVGGVLAGGGLLWFLNQEGRTPREWAPYLERRADRHRSIIVDSTSLVADTLLSMDRLARQPGGATPTGIGAAPERSGIGGGRVRAVMNQADLAAAVANAQPGDVIQLMPGRHVFQGRQMSLSRAGLPQAPITIRAARLGDVVIEAQQGVVFKLFAPFWRFENLVIRGACTNDTDCEHAFHIVGDARGTLIQNNRLEDLNAAIKINGENGQFPDDGQIIGNTFLMNRPRDTLNPLTPIDLVAASNWRIAQNFIADVARKYPDKPTYAAFAKGAGERNVFERNVVLCEWKLRGPEQRVGLSLGGGGTGQELTRDKGRSGMEQISGVIRDNLIAFCSDVGIYLNKASKSVVEHNTLLDTAGIDVRFPESSADVVANVVDGSIRARDGGLLRDRDNEIGPLLGLFIGYHPVRALFADVATLNLAWAARPKAPGVGGGRADLCGAPRPAAPVAGAFEDWSRCR